MGKIELRKPVLINGKEIRELTYDINEITCDDFTAAFNEAGNKALISAQNSKPSSTLMEQDGNVHFYMGIHAILAVNPDIDLADLERIKGYDLIQITKIGRNFILGKVEEHSDQSNSEEQSEAIPESITPESKK